MSEPLSRTLDSKAQGVPPGDYECYWCHFQTPREEWGPGWVRCPKCKRIAPSAAEVAHGDAAAMRLSTVGAYTLKKIVRDIIAGHGAGYTNDIDARTAEVMTEFEAWLQRRQSSSESVVDWKNKLVADLREVGVVGELCLGCGKVDCGGCPAGSGTAVLHTGLSREASEKLHQLWARRREAERGNIP